MGGAVTTSNKQPVDDVFTQTALQAEFSKFIIQENAAISFALFVKNGHWLGMLTHFDHCDHSKQVTPKSSIKRNTAHWIYLHYKITDELKTQIDEFLKQSKSYEASVHASNSSKKSDRPTNLEFHESYKYNPDTATFSINEMSAILCSILFPLYLGSEEYQHWKSWLKAKSKKINGNFLASISTDQTNEFSSCATLDVDEENGTADVEHMKHILLSTAAFLDQSDLIAHLMRPTLFHDAQISVTSSNFGICICNATSTVAAVAGTTIPTTSTSSSSSSNNNTEYPIIYANKSFEKLTGYTFKQIQQKSISILYGNNTEKLGKERIQVGFKEQRVTKLILTLYKRNNTKFLTAIILKPSYDNTGSITYWIVLFYEISRKGASLSELKRMDDLLALIPNLLFYPTPSL